MMAPRSRSSTLLCIQMLHIVPSFNPNNSKLKWVSSLFTPLSLFSTKARTFTACVTDPSLKPQKDLSSINFNGIAQSVMSKYSHIMDKSNGETDNFVNDYDGSLKALLLDISDVVPDVARSFLRISRLKPDDVLEMLMGFQCECETVTIESKKVESLWEIFKCASNQDKGFRHHPKSYEVMASILVRYGMFREIQLLLLAMEKQGILMDNSEIFVGLIEGYVGVNDLERAVLVYEQMREHDLVPPFSCYRALIDLLVRAKRTRLAFRVSLDMVKLGIRVSDGENATFDNVVRLLISDGMIQEGRDLIKNLVALGFQPNSLVVNEVACGYCEKKDFDDSLKFLVEMKCSPNVLTGNTIISSLCNSFSVERANLVRLELERLGFMPDEITFKILICWCCREGNLRTAFIYLSEMLSRGLKPHLWCYNALISAMFKKGMWKHARDIRDEMEHSGATPGLSTFKIFLAGYCKVRQFDEAKNVVHEMVNHGLIEPALLEDTLSKAFMVLGLDPSSVRLKRDNDVGFSKTEFFDSLGNGLYLDTDIDEYDKRLTRLIEASLIPDFNSLISKECDHGNFKAAYSLTNEMAHWDQELSLSVFSALVKGLCSSRFLVKSCSNIIEKMPKLANQLDQEVLNLLVQTYCKVGLTYKGWIIFNQMLQRKLMINSGTYTALMRGLCKKKNLWSLNDCWDIARNDKWLPVLEDCSSLVVCLCQNGMLKEVIDLLESLLLSYPDSRSVIFHMFLEKLSLCGFTTIAQLLVEELLQQGCLLDQNFYSYLLRGLCKERKYTVAFTILDTMLARNLFPCFDVSLILIPHLCRADKLQRAIALIENGAREQSQFSLSVHGTLIKAFCTSEKVGEAANLLQDMWLKGLAPDADIYNMLFQGYCQANNVRKVQELLGILVRKNMNLSISSYRSYVRMMCLDGRVAYALSLKELMLAGSKYDNLNIYNILIFYLLCAGNNVLVKDVLNELLEKGLLLDEVTYNFLVYGFSKCKDVFGSLHYLSAMISKELRPSHRSLRTVITCLSDIGELGKVLELSQEMELRGRVHGSIIQNSIVEGLLSHGKVREAEQFLDRMADKYLIPHTINYDNLIKRFCSYKRLNKAVDLLNIMLKKGNTPSSTSYDSIIHGFCTQNQLYKAMDFLTEMLDRSLKPSIDTWDLLICKFSQQGLPAEAEKLLISMVQVGETPTRLMCSSVIDSYRSQNNPRKASELMQMMQQIGHEPDFDTHWSLINNLSHSNNSSDKDNDKSNQGGFLSSLLAGSGFSSKKDLDAKLR